MVHKYAELIKLAAMVIIGIGIAIGGALYGKSIGKAERVKLEAQVSSLLDTTKKWEEIDARNRATIEANLREAEKWKRAAEKAARDIEHERTRAERATKEKQAALDKARQTPECARLLEMEVCAVIPLP